MRVSLVSTVLACVALAAAVRAHEGTPTIPVPLETPLPEYPANMRESGNVGEVEVLVVVSETGSVDWVAVADSTHGEIEEPALEAIKKWRFSPGAIDGEPHGIRCVVTVTFNAGKVSASPIELHAQYDSPPKLMKSVRPEYPTELAYTLSRGRVVAQFVVDKRGEIRSPKVVEATHPAFEAPAIAALVKWKFSPAKTKGKPTAAWVQQGISFDMDWAPTNEPFTTVEALRESAAETAPQKLPQRLVTVFAVHPYDDAVKGKPGAAEVRFLVNEKGEVVSTQVLRTSTADYGLSLAAALEAWKFDPVLRDGAPAQAIMRQMVVFKPGDRDSVIVSDTADLAERIRKNRFKPADRDKLDSPPKPRYAPDAIYPTALRERRSDGTAKIEVIVDRKGRAVLPRIVEASEPEFGWAAATAVQRWRFEPPTVNGKAVEVKVMIPVKFTAPEPVSEEGEPAK